jgi:hypothetical protein
MMVRWHKGLFSVFVLALSCSTGAAGGGADAAPEPAKAQRSDWIEAVKSDIEAFPYRLAEDARATFLNDDNAGPLLAAGMLSVAMHNGGADDHVAGHFERHSHFRDCSDETLDVLGAPFTHSVVAFSWSLLTLDSGDSVHHRCARTLQRALALNTVTFYALKAARHNDTPNGKSWAWPSGHTSSSFTVASVLHEYYGLKVGIPAYALAGLVGYRMMDTGDHWASDVAFGATLGWIVGHTVARKHKGPEVASFGVLPYFGNYDAPALGISLVRRF